LGVFDALSLARQVGTAIKFNALDVLGGRNHGQTLRNQEIPRIPIGYLRDRAAAAKGINIFLQYDLHVHISGADQSFLALIRESLYQLDFFPMLWKLRASATIAWA
jgi:hypothetical protein